MLIDSVGLPEYERGFEEFGALRKEYRITDSILSVIKLYVYFVLSLLLFGCGSDSRQYVDKMSRKYDPAQLKLTQGFNIYVRRARIQRGLELGYILFSDGDKVKYWFRSHHFSDDMGSTLFEFSDGEHRYIAGWFCCEVQLPETQFPDKDALKAFIREHDGISP